MTLPERASMRRRSLRWRTAKPLRDDSRLRGRKADFDQLSRAHQPLLKQLNTIYVEARLYLHRQDRKDCQKIVVDAVDAALGETDAAKAAEHIAATEQRAQAFLQERAEWTTHWGGRSRITPLREDSLVHDAQLSTLWKAHPGPVGELNKAYLEAQLYLRGRDLDTCLEMIRSTIHVAEDNPENTQQMLDKEASRVKRFLNERAEQTARRLYATGLYLGVAISAVVLTAVALVAIAVIRLFLSLRGDDEIPTETLSALRDVLVCIGGGAAGAVVSTILRVSNTDRIDYRVVTLRTAAFRIVLGWLFAAALLFLIDGSIVTVFNVPNDEAGVKSFFFWGGVGFLGGFNEVWARNLVTRSGSAPDPGGSKPQQGS
jgi:hypothetical protein